MGLRTMEANIYSEMYAVEQTHWWFVARRAIIRAQLEKLNLDAESARILDVGCGTGGNLALLMEYGKVYAMEANPDALKMAQTTTDIEIMSGYLPDTIPFEEDFFDLIVAFDVLEHVESDQESLMRLKKHLKSSGVLMITVPALPILWTKHDDMHHHYRRYLKTSLIAQFKKAGYHPVFSNYFNFLLFPLIFIIRMGQKFLNLSVDSNLTQPRPMVNNTLRRIFSFERYMLDKFPFPFGVSLIMTAKNKVVSE
jgi:SAM-dependent methyltransferase